MKSSLRLMNGGFALRSLALAGILQAASAFSAAFHPAVPGVSANLAGTNASFSSGLNIRQTGSNIFEIGLVRLDASRRTISLPARVRLRDEVVEYALVTEEGKGYESIFTTAARPADIHVAALLLGLGEVPVTGDANTGMDVPATNSVLLRASWQTNHQEVSFPLCRLVQITAGGTDRSAPEMRAARWLYNGSVVDKSGFAAQREGSIVSLIRDPVALINNPGADRDRDTIHFPNANLLPAKGTEVRITIEAPAFKPK